MYISFVLALRISLEGRALHLGIENIQFILSLIGPFAPIFQAALSIMSLHTYDVTSSLLFAACCIVSPKQPLGFLESNRVLGPGQQRRV